MGVKIYSILLQNDARDKLTGICNVQCWSVVKYKRFVNKIHKICIKYVKFSSHPKNLDGIFEPSNDELTRLEFNNVTTALANTVKAMENVSTKTLGKNDINKIMEEAVAKVTAIVRTEMKIIKTNLHLKRRYGTDKTTKITRTKWLHYGKPLTKPLPPSNPRICSIKKIHLSTKTI